MVFNIDFNNYKLVDLSKLVIPNQAGDRPYIIQESQLPDRTYKFDILNSHTHVGTHVESPWHFYHSGKTISDFPLEKFMGVTRLYSAQSNAPDGLVQVDELKRSLEPHRGSFEILFVRRAADRPALFELDSVEYIRTFNLKLLVFEWGINFGRDIEEGRTFHNILMQNDVCLVEFPEQCGELDRDEFYLFAPPMRIQSIDSAMCRLFAVVEK